MRSSLPRVRACSALRKAPKKEAKPMDMRLGVDVGKGAGGRHAVFQREACTGRRLGAIRQHPPVAVGPTADFERTEMQVVPRRV